MSQDMSITQVVNHIVESLTESVTQLIVVVIPLQESGGDMPPGLPGGANGVAKAAQTLSQAAVQLAEDEYEDFPEIHSQIVTAANEVMKAANNLIKSVNELSTKGTKVAGWDGLVDACQIISGQTILLLQIVYGAQLQKIFMAGDRALSALNVDSDRALTDAEAFAGDVSGAAQQAAQLAQYLREKAEDTEVPEERSALEDAATDLDARASALIEMTNELLANPEDKNAARRFDDALVDVKQSIKRSRDLLANDLANAEDKIKQSQSQLEDPGDLYPTLPRAPARDIEVERELVTARALPSAVSRLLYASEPDDATTLKGALSDLEDLHDDLTSEVNAFAKATSDPAERRGLQSALGDLDRMISDQQEAVRQYQSLRNPEDKRRAQGLSDEIGRTISRMEDVVRPGAGLASDASSVAREVLQVQRVAADEPGALDEGIAREAGAIDALDARVRAAVARANPEDKARLQAAVDDLTLHAPKQQSAARALASNPTDKAAQRSLAEETTAMLDALERVAQVADPTTRNSVVQAAKDAKAHVESLEAAAHAQDVAQSARHGQDARDAQRLLAQAARDAAEDTIDPRVRRDLLDAAQQLDACIPDAWRAVDAVLSNPRDASAQSRLHEDDHAVLRAAARAAGVLDPISGLDAAADGASQAVLRLKADHEGGAPTQVLRSDVETLDRALDDLEEHAVRYSDGLPHADRLVAMNAAVENLKHARRAHTEAAQAALANPSDKSAQKALDEACDTLDDAIHGVRSAAHSDARDAVHRACDVLDREVALLDKAQCEGLPEVKQQVRRVGQAHKDVHNAVQALDPSDHARQNAVLDALKDVDQSIPRVINASHQAALDPSRSGDLLASEQEASRGIQGVRDALARDEADRLAARYRDLAAQLKRMAETVNEEDDVPSGARTTKRTAHETPQLGALARAYAGGGRASEDDARRIIAATNHAEELLPVLVDAFASRAKDPSDAKRQDRLREVSEVVQHALERAAESLDPSERTAAVLVADKDRQAALGDLDAARRAKDARTTSKALHDAHDALERLRAGADVPDGDARVAKALEEMDGLLPMLLPLGDAVLRNPEDKSAQSRLDEALLGLDRAATALVNPQDKAAQRRLPECESARAALDALSAASARQSPGDISACARALATAAPAAASAAREAAGPDEADGVHKAALVLEALIPATLEAAHARAKDPQDARRQRALEDHVGAMRQGLDALEGRAEPPSAFSSAEREEASESLSRGRVELCAAATRLRADPLDHAAQQAVYDAASKLSDPLEAMMRCTDASPQQRVRDLCEHQVSTLDTLDRAGPAGEASVFSGAAKQLVQDHEKLRAVLAPLLEDKEAAPAAADAKDPVKEARRLRLQQAALEVDALLPAVVEQGTAALRNPSDKAAQKGLGDAVRRTQQAYRALAQAADPRDAPGVEEAAKEVLLRASALQAASEAGDGTQGQSEAAQLSTAVEELLRCADPLARAARETDERLGDALKRDVEQVRSSHKPVPALGETALANPSDRKAQAELADGLSDLRGAVEGLQRRAQARVLAEVQREHAELERLVGATTRRAGNPKDVAQRAKAVAHQAAAVVEVGQPAADALEDDDRKVAVYDALNELNGLLPNQVRAVKAVLPNPSDKMAQDRVEAMADQMHAPLSRIQNALLPTPGHSVQAAADDLIGTLGRLKVAALDGDAPEAGRAAKNASERAAALREACASMPEHKKTFDALLDRVDGALRDLPRVAVDAASSPSDHGRQAALDCTLNAVRVPTKHIRNLAEAGSDSPHEAAKRAAAILAGLNASRGRRGNGKDLLAAAEELAALMGSLVGDGVIPAAREAEPSLDVNELLSDLDALALSTPKLEPKSKASKSSDDVASIDEAMASRPKPEVGSLAHKLEVSRQEKIEKPLAEMKKDVFEYKHMNNINDALKALIEAARTGNRSAFLVCARQVAQFVKQLTDELRAKAKTVKDPSMKSQLLRDIGVLKDFSIQLKILASVRASQSTTNPDTDKQLSMLADNMGNILNQTMNTCSIIRIKNKSF